LLFIGKISLEDSPSETKELSLICINETKMARQAGLEKLLGRDGDREG
jgi:hypothetical protein